MPGINQECEYLRVLSENVFLRIDAIAKKNKDPNVPAINAVENTSADPLICRKSAHDNPPNTEISISFENVFSCATLVDIPIIQPSTDPSNISKSISIFSKCFRALAVSAYIYHLLLLVPLHFLHFLT